MQNTCPRPMTFQPDIYGKVLPYLPAGTCCILDVGSGEGYFSKQLMQAGHKVEACDFCEESFKCPDIPFTKVDLNKALPYESNKFDCVVAIEVIEHIENHFCFVSELIRVTKPGGIVIITTPNVVSLSSRWHFFKYGYNDCAPVPLCPDSEDYYMQHINPISLPELLFHVERFGADVVQIGTNRLRRSSFFAKILRPLFALAIRGKLLRPKHSGSLDLHRRHIRWMLSPASLMGRIMIAVSKKRMP